MIQFDAASCPVLCVAALHENLSSYSFFRNTPLNSCCQSDRRSTRWGSTSWDSRCVYTTMLTLLTLLSGWVHCTNSAGRRRFYINAAQNYSVRRWVTQLYVPEQFVSCRLYLYLGGRVRRKSDAYPRPPMCVATKFINNCLLKKKKKKR